jgi:hypothetical protein
MLFASLGAGLILARRRGLVLVDVEALALPRHAPRDDPSNPRTARLVYPCPHWYLPLPPPLRPHALSAAHPGAPSNQQETFPHVAAREE